MPRLDWESIQGLSLPERNIIALTHVGAILILANSVFYRQRYNWEYDGNDITDTQWDEIGHCIGRMEHELMSGLVGMIVPHFMGSIAGLNLLPCDGSIYNREDYPLLYAAIKSVFQIDADTFYVPDLRGLFPRGETEDEPMGSSGGEEFVTLQDYEMPVHTHTAQPHAHSEVGAVSTIINGGLEAPASAATPLPTTTGLETVIIDNAGGGEPHENKPPYRTVGFAIVAG